MDIMQLLGEKIQPVINLLVSNKYRFPEIQRAWNQSFSEMGKRLGTNHLEITASTEGQQQANQNKLLCYVKESKPHVVVYLPPLMFSFMEAKEFRPVNYELIFETMIVIDFIHELDHLALGTITGNILEDERITWSRTCENSIRPFVEFYGLEINPTHQKVYSDWLWNGRNGESQGWKDAIAKLYKL